MFTTSIFPIARTWRQPRCPSTNEWVKMIYNGILLSNKNNAIMPFAATWLSPEIIILSEKKQIEKCKCHMISFICGTFKKRIQMNLVAKQK